MAFFKNAVIIINSVPFVIPDSRRCVQESSVNIVDINRYPALENQFILNQQISSSSPLTLSATYYNTIQKSLDVSIRLTSSSDGFNLYNSLKTAVDGLIALTQRFPYNRFLNYISYWGHREYLEYGQITQSSFSSDSSTNSFVINLSMESFKFDILDSRALKATTSPI